MPASASGVASAFVSTLSKAVDGESPRVTSSDCQPTSSRLTPASEGRLPTSALAVAGLSAVLSGDIGMARHHLASLASERCAAPYAERDVWLLCVRTWLESEVARAESAFDTAARHAARMTQLAQEARLLPLVLLGRVLASDLHAAAGDSRVALQQLHLHIADERAVQVLQLETRDELAQFQVAARRGALEMNEVSERALKFEKWAHEDALTGIANLRRFNQCLHEWGLTGKPLCVALIDVNSFRDINNNFSYETGNQALRGIAEQMVAHVRGVDLPARWGGDEFVILFRDTDLDSAAQAVERIKLAVKENDWSAIAPGLRVTVSVGVTEARPGDTKESLIARSEESMYRQKLAHKQADLERAMPAAVLRRVASWLRDARRVVVYVGAGTTRATGASANLSGVTTWTSTERDAFAHVQGLVAEPEQFNAFWRDWRRANQARQPTQAQRDIVVLSRKFEQVTFVTERVDGILAMAGAVDVLELYGNAFRERCSGCERVRPNSDQGRCLVCDAPGVTLRPDITLLGEMPDNRLLAGAELLLKRADLVLVLDSDATLYPGSSMLDKARARGARIVMMGGGDKTRRQVADISLDVSPQLAIEALAHAMTAKPNANDAESALSDEGFEAMAFLTGRCSDNFGYSLDEALGWSNVEFERRLGTLPWIFPLTTRSSINSLAPSPTAHDFRLMAADAQVRASVRAAFEVMLRFYGFEWRAGEVRLARDWRACFDRWCHAKSLHDLFISRILGAMTLLGLRDEALAFKAAATEAVKTHRAFGRSLPLLHWNLAVNGETHRRSAAPSSSVDNVSQDSWS